MLVCAEFERVLGKKNLETLADEPAQSLALNDIGRVIVRAHRPLHFDAYTRNRKTGTFIVIDAPSNATVAAGMIIGPVGEGAPVARAPARQGSTIAAREREFALGQRAAAVLLTG